MKQFMSLMGAGLAGSLITLGTYKALDLDQKNVVFQKAEEKPAYQLASSVPIGPELDFSAQAEKVTPAVVNIKAKQTVTTTGLPQNDIFRDFFGGGSPFFMEPQGQPKEQERASTGSGVIISKDGYIVTNNHVVADATELEVSLSDKRTYKAKVIGTDPSTDLAVIQIKENNLPVLAFGNSDKVKVGSWVLAVGNPFNLTSTVTAGVVSAKARNISILRERSNVPIESFIQTDAAINPGNSGGALVNLNGDLIGINTAIASPTGAYSGYGFAVPVNLVTKVVEDIIKFGSVQRGFLGIIIRDLDGNLAKKQDLEISEGVLVDSVNKESAAMEAGVKKGDVIVKVGQTKINSVAELQEQIARHRPGDKVNLTVYRDGKETILATTLKNKDGKSEITKSERKEIFEVLGAEFSDLTAKEKKNAKVETGVKVSRIYPGGKIRSQTEMKDGFIITKVDRQPVKSAKEFAELMEKKSGGVMLEGVYEDLPGNYYFALGL
jgi:Do/DeqQ family serine protease